MLCLFIDLLGVFGIIFALTSANNYGHCHNIVNVTKTNSGLNIKSLTTTTTTIFMEIIFEHTILSTQIYIEQIQ